MRHEYNNMVNISDMVAEVGFLDEIRKNERAKAAVQLQAELDAFVAHYWYASTGRSSITGYKYVLLRVGLIFRKKEDEEDGETVTTKDLSIEEMEFIHEFIFETLNNDIQYIEDEIDRYIDLCQ